MIDINVLLKALLTLRNIIHTFRSEMCVWPRLRGGEARFMSYPALVLEPSGIGAGIVGRAPAPARLTSSSSL
ncbi:MAG: hypothetical protein PHS77_06625, partial [Gallionellaceae bacterium]|nr:hypothetical protein [Gallionellaceae bacterium]